MKMDAKKIKKDMIPIIEAALVEGGIVILDQLSNALKRKRDQNKNTRKLV